MMTVSWKNKLTSSERYARELLTSCIQVSFGHGLCKRLERLGTHITSDILLGFSPVFKETEIAAPLV